VKQRRDTNQGSPSTSHMEGNLK